MSNVVENFNKILAKAEENGFEFRSKTEIKKVEFMGFGRFDITLIPFDSEQESSFVFHWNELFFNHNFARCFFGEDSYKIQLQAMVLEANPMEYLVKFL